MGSSDLGGAKSASDNHLGITQTGGFASLVELFFSGELSDLGFEVL